MPANLEWIDHVLDESRTRGPSRLTMVALACHADPDGMAYPGEALLSERTKLAPRTVRQSLAEAVAAGELEYHGRRSRAGAHMYRILLGPNRATEADPLAVAAARRATPRAALADFEPAYAPAATAPSPMPTDLRTMINEAVAEAIGSQPIPEAAPAAWVHPAARNPETWRAYWTDPEPDSDELYVTQADYLLGRRPTGPKWDTLKLIITELYDGAGYRAIHDWPPSDDALWRFLESDHKVNAYTVFHLDCRQHPKWEVPPVDDPADPIGRDEPNHSYNEIRSRSWDLLVEPGPFVGVA